DHRQNPPSHIDDAGHKGRGAGQGRQTFQRMHLLYTGGFQSIPLKRQRELNDLKLCDSGLTVLLYPGKNTGPLAEYPPGVIQGWRLCIHDLASVGAAGAWTTGSNVVTISTKRPAVRPSASAKAMSGGSRLATS